MSHVSSNNDIHYLPPGSLINQIYQKDSVTNSV